MKRVTRRRVWIAVTGVFVCVALVARPHVVERYGLYLGSPAEANEARLYLDPFPDRASCETRVAVFTRNAERAFCAGGARLEFGSSIDAILAADFQRLFPAGWYCEPVRRTRPPRAVSTRADRTSASSSTFRRNRTA